MIERTCDHCGKSVTRFSEKQEAINDEATITIHQHVQEAGAPRRVAKISYQLTYELQFDDYDICVACAAAAIGENSKQRQSENHNNEELK